MNAQMLEESAQMDAKICTNVGADAQMHTPPLCKRGGCSAHMCSICAEAFVQTEAQADQAYVFGVSVLLRERFGEGVRRFATDDLERIPRFGVKS